MRVALLLVLIPALAAGCSLWPRVDRTDVQQGNKLDAAEIEQLRVGMTRDEVRALLGAPVLNTTFHSDRWVYVYYVVEAGRAIEGGTQRLVVHFDGDRVVRIEDGYASPSSRRAAVTG